MALTVVFALPDSLTLWVQGIVEALPELLGTIQAQLLDLLSLVLAGRPYRESIHPSHLTAYHAAVTHGECRYATLVLNHGNQDTIPHEHSIKQPGFCRSATFPIAEVCATLVGDLHLLINTRG